MAKIEPRYMVTRMVKDRSVPERYRRSGWMAFDTLHQRHGPVWPTKAEAEADTERLNRMHSERRAIDSPSGESEVR